ncbi:MAG: DEAD/DEAH box helicase [Salinivirgaceae bacterium]|jgi:ATP-dependent RNA helicase RhlE|nr:DEAD/DEAH box helicase [Salinivirgaceae bacterium]
MKLKKLLPELVSGIVDEGFDEEPRVIQSLAVPKIKSGADLFVVGDEGIGKSTAINIGVIQQLKQEFEKAPRALIIVANKEKAFAMDEQFELLAKYTSLRALVVYDEGNLNYQKDMIYEGIDVLITTPKRLNELVNNTGIPLVKIKMLVVDDAETIFKSQNHTIVHRIADSIDKAQMIVIANSWHSKFDDLSNRIMKNPQIVKI